MFSFVCRLQALGVLLFFAALSCLHAQWQPLNQPFKASVSGLFADNGIILATATTGLYKSTDDGKNWTRCHTSNEIKRFVRIGSTLYASTHTGILTSNDNGDTWEYLQMSLPGLMGINDIAAHGTTLFLSGTGTGVCFSTDGGQTWTADNEGLPSDNMGLLFSDGTDVYTIANGFGTDQSGIFKRKAEGGWSKINSQDITGQHIAIINTTIFLWGWNGGYRSEDRGQTWEPLTPLGSSQFFNVNSLQNIGSTLFASSAAIPGVFRSTDNGRTWIHCNLDARALSLSVHGIMLVAGTQDKGIYTSNDDGDTWQSTNAGLHSSVSIPRLESSGNDIYAYVFPDIYKSTDGINWSTLPPLPPTTGSPLSMSALDSIVVIGTSGRGLWYINTRSEEMIWQQAADLPDQADISCILKNGSTLLVGLKGIITQGTSGVYISTDMGQTWEPSDLSSAVSTIAPHKGVLYASSPAGGFFVSADGGNHWTPKTADSMTVRSILSFTSNNRALFATSYSANILISQDDGVTWITDPSGMIGNRVRDFAVYGTTVFTGTQLGVYSSEDNGITWEALNTGIERISVQQVSIAGDYLYIGTAGNGIWRRPLSELTTTTVKDAAPVRLHYSLHPHPITGSSVLHLCSTCELRNATLTLSALNGLRVHSVGNLHGTTVAIERGNLAPGVYVFTIEEAGAVVASGTVVVE